ncbi:beta-N-acetylglucosaminidase [Polaribacter ponticola]|uniref:Beta-N-acetylglucosaminidase domain-containing protein n=1 Tax=Polaribacter ponticola TaxID=2978475 RepID=A0ABT5SB58_9FLAO|nr:beta-N-acetylglucosaminidase [Polaribacter sp. MSW5]MDD7915356.1 beta-N-acetylglucosaminidase domain-containing protein [Polaribacter sp. MSW5]
MNRQKQKSTLKMRIILLVAFVLVSNFGFAQNLNINPTPQQFVSKGTIKMPTDFYIQQKNIDTATHHLLSTFFTSNNTNTKGFSIIIGDVNSKISRKLKRKVPAKAESYFIKSTDKNITVIGRDARGTYYGVRTLLALLQHKEIPLGEITDYPDVAARGTVEGFYGTPWSFKHRIRQIDFYGENKLNTYIYGPKDDAYHSSPNWRKPYPENEAAQLKKLIDRAALNHVDFVWAIHPGKDIKWNDEDRKNLLNKFQLMYDLGVRAFAVFFDDISGKGTNPKQQASLLNFLHTNFIKKKKDVKPLIMCPTEYNKGWSKPEGGYLKTLGKELDPSIRIMWTGNTVVADVDKETMNWINTEINRKAFIWWNFPVSDYVRNHMLLGPTYGNGKDIANDVSGFVSNPMEHAEASKIAIYGVADYSWNMTNYQPEKKWLEALKVVMPESYNALEIFAKHNSDLGPNGHRYRRKESVSFAPEARAFLEDLEANREIKNFNVVQKEFQAIVEASYILANSTDNTVLLDEIGAWVAQFQLLGQSGLSMLNMHTALKSENTKDFERSYHALKAIKTEMYKIDREENQNPYQPGIKTATLVLAPFIDKSFVHLTNAYNKEFGKNLEVDANYNPHLLFTNVAQLRNQPVTLRDRTLAINPPLEVINIAPKDYFGFELSEEIRVTKLILKAESTTAYKNLIVETSTNGTNWSAIKTSEKGESLEASINKKVKYIRVINATSKVLAFKINQFWVLLK